MGEVHVVEHTHLGCSFALKVLHPRLGRFADRFRVEAQALGCVNHPNVVGVVDFWITPSSVPCIIMDLLNGHTLAREFEDRRGLPIAEAIDLSCQTLAALSAAHSAGLVHRDIKPENLFLHQEPGGGRVLKVLDFGLTRVLPRSEAKFPRPPAIPTDTGTVVGSPRYMSPEAARGERVDGRADLYAVGLILYEMLCGVGPYDHDDVALPPSRRSQPAVPAELDGIVMRAIDERPSDRFQTADEMLCELVAFETRRSM
jgi:serine/threonine-protein kinase